MAITYELTPDQAQQNISNSLLSDDIKSAINSILAEKDGETTTIVDNYAPGNSSGGANIDIALIDSSTIGSKQVSIKDPIDTLIVKGGGDVNLKVIGSNTDLIALGDGNNSLDLSDAVESRANFAASLDGSAPFKGVLVYGGAGADIITGSAGADYIDGRDGNDTLIANGAGDTLHGGSGYNYLVGDQDEATAFQISDGSDTVLGGDGVDLVSFGEVDIKDTNVAYQDLSSRGEYTVDWDGKTAIVHNASTGQTSELNGVEYLQWADSALVVASDDLEGGIARLYETLFDRAGDYEGIKYWFEAYRDGASLHDIAASFLESEEAAPISALSDAEFVDLLYTNLLDRPADAEGAQYWQGELAESGDRADVAARFLLTEESVNKTSEVIHILSDDDQIV